MFGQYLFFYPEMPAFHPVRYGVFIPRRDIMIRLKDHRPGTERDGLMKMYPTPEMIREAAVTLRGVARQTPVLPFGRQGGTLFLKAENLQETGSFKIRGAYNKVITFLFCR